MIRETLREITRRVSEITDDTALEAVIQIVSDLQAAYAANKRVPAADAAPYAVFERLIELFKDRISSQDERLLTQLSLLPSDPFIVSPLMDHVRTTRIASYDGILERDADDRTARVGRAALRVQSHDPEGAVEDLAHVADSEDHELLARLAAARIQARHYTDALRDLDRLIVLDPRDESARRARARLYVEHDYPDLAEPDIEVLSGSSDPEILAFCAWFRVNHGSPAEASALARRAASIAGGRSKLVLFSETLLAEGKYEEALSVARRALYPPSIGNDSEARSGEVERAMRVVAWAQLGLGMADAAAETWLEIFALMGVGYENWRGYVVATERQLHHDTKELDHSYLHPGAAEPGAAPDGVLLDAYAAALSARGDPRAELLRVGFDSNSSHEPLLDADIVEKATRLWVEANMNVEYRFGLPWSVSVRDLQNAPYIERLPWIYAVRCLTLTEARREVHAAARWLFAADLQALQRITIAAEFFSFEGVRRLVEAPFFHRLRSIRLTGCSLDAPAFELLLRRLPTGIQELSILGGDTRPTLGLQPRLGELFQSSGSLEELTILELASCHLGVEEVRKILSTRMPRLEKLRMSDNDLGMLDPEELLSFPMVRQVTELCIGYTGLEKRALPRILDHAGDLALTTIGVEGEWTPDEVTAVRSHPNFSRFQEIEFGINPVSQEESWMDLFDPA